MQALRLGRTGLLRQLTTPTSGCANRLIHQSAVVYGKKKTAGLGLTDDLFGEGTSDSGDLFGSTPGKEGRKAAVPTPADPQHAVSPRRRLDPTERTTRFNELFDFVSSRIGLKPAAKTPEQVRDSAWGHLFDLATTRAQLERVAELFPRWRDSRRKFNEQTAKNFVRRCDELECSDLALDVFSDHSKYGLPLASAAVARLLMHSLHYKHPLASSVTLMALYPAYNLPPISTDLVSSAMLAAACLQQESKQSKVLLDVLLPSIRNLLKDTPPIPASKPIHYSEDREPFWLARTLERIEDGLRRLDDSQWLGKWRGDYQWVHEWRVRSGHFTSAP